ncbi:MAG: tripartite tricarboxylate transporter TctB family protein [Rhodospirillaceae bacterium]
MQLRICSQKDFYAGLMFTGFGIFALYEAHKYDMGVIERMGPGYFPTILGALLVGLGLAVFVRSFFSGVATKIRVDLRPIVLVLSGVVAFGLLLNVAGLVVAAFALITLACLGSWEFRLRDTLIMFVILVAFCTLVFYYGLEVSMPLWPEF